MKELLEKAINNYKNGVDEEGTFKTFCEIYEKTGNEEAELYMGKMLYFGWGTEKNLEKAYKIMQKLYDKDRKAREVIADMYFYGVYLEQDVKKAFELYTELVGDGEGAAGYSTLMLGKCYRYGIGTEVDFEKAFELFKKSSELGNKYAYFDLANMYWNGRGVEQDSEKAFECASKSVEFGDDRSCFMLGCMYFHGIGVEKDSVKSFEFLKSAVEHGCDEACFLLGVHYLEGLGTEKNNEKAFEYIKKGAELDKRAYYWLGEMYLNGDGTEKDHEKAVEMFKRVVDWDDNAQCALGMIYFRGKENGYDVEENKEYGLELLIKSATNGNKVAIDEIGELASNGEKCVIEKLKELVENGKDMSGYYSYFLGKCYEFEYGVEKDLTKAFKYYKSAVELGCDKACFFLGMAYLLGTGTEENHKKAVETLKRVVDWDENSQYVLGKLYLEGKENGIDIEENKEYGLELIRKAAEAGHEEAINKIKELEEKDNDSQLDKNINYFEKGVEEFKKGNYEQAEKEFENDKKIFLAENRDYKSKGNPYLAFMYYYGIGKKVDYEKAWKECNNVIEVAVRFDDYCDSEQVNNNIISHYLVGKMLNNGEGVKQNVDEALRQFKFIADEYKIKELIKEDYLFNIILNEYKETEAQYVYSLIYGPSATKEKFEEKDKVENNS